MIRCCVCRYNVWVFDGICEEENEEEMEEKGWRVGLEDMLCGCV